MGTALVVGTARYDFHMTNFMAPEDIATAYFAASLAGLGGMFAMTKQVDVVHRWVDGPDVLTWFELRTASAGPLAIVNWTHVEAGRIASIRVTFDPRPLLV